MDHPSFSTNAQLPSVRVSLPLIKELEAYLKLQEIKLALDAPKRGSGSELIIKIQDDEGVEKIASAAEYTRDKFVDSTRTVGMDFHTAVLHESGVLRVTIHFAPTRSDAKVSVRAEMPGAREAAINVRDGIVRIACLYRTRHWLYGPPFLLALAMIFVASLGVAAALETANSAQTRAFGGAAALFFYFWGAGGILLRPYIDFDSVAIKRADDVWKWAVGTALGLCGSLLLVATRGLFGF